VHLHASLFLYLFVYIGFAQQHGDLQLAGNFSNPVIGRLEIYINNMWGTVCIDGFTMESANTACRQLGRARAITFMMAGSSRYVCKC